MLCHCRVTLQSHCSCSNSSPPHRGVSASVGTCTLGQRVCGKILLCCFFQGILGCSFFACGRHPTVGGGISHSNICAAGLCTVYLHFFPGDARGIFYECMHVCTLAHVCVALYSCKYVCPDLLIFLPLLLCFLVCRSVRYHGDQFSVRCGHIKNTFGSAQPIQVCFFLSICTSPSPPFGCMSARPFLLPLSATAVRGDGSADYEGFSTILRSNLIRR